MNDVDIHDDNAQSDEHEVAYGEFDDTQTSHETVKTSEDEDDDVESPDQKGRGCRIKKKPAYLDSFLMESP